MEGIPAPDVAEYKRKKELELGLTPGTISQPPAKRPKFENRVLTAEELKLQLEAHKALMNTSEQPAMQPMAVDIASGPVVNAAPQAYAAPPIVPPGGPGLPSFMPPGGMPPPGMPGAPPFPPPFPGAGMPPGYVIHSHFTEEQATNTRFLADLLGTACLPVCHQVCRLLVCSLQGWPLRVCRHLHLAECLPGCLRSCPLRQWAKTHRACLLQVLLPQAPPLQASLLLQRLQRLKHRQFLHRRCKILVLRSTSRQRDRRCPVPPENRRTRR